MGLSNVERQRRWQERNLIKLKATAKDIVSKLLGMPDPNKLCEIVQLINGHLGIDYDKLVREYNELDKKFYALKQITVEDLTKENAKLQRKEEDVRFNEQQKKYNKHVKELNKEITKLQRRVKVLETSKAASEIAGLFMPMFGVRTEISEADYRSIRACLHPDRVADPELKKRYQEAFQVFSNLFHEPKG